MALTDEARRVVEVNAPFSRLLDYPPSVLKGRPIYEIVYGGPLMTPNEWRAAMMGSGGTDEAVLERADASIVAVQFAWHTETVSTHRLVLFVCMTVSRWGRHFRRAGDDVDTPAALSNRERQIVEYVALGATSAEIADTLNISGNTVRKHVTNSMGKLGARSRAQLVAKAIADGHVAT
jgi:DNA-binding CsgD family transcriptional regulator